MKIKKGLETEYKKFVERNSQDAYSNGVIKYMEKWVQLMEKNIKNMTPEKCEQLSFEADEEGITGAMYGFAKSAIAKFWEHGYKFKDWIRIGEDTKYNEWKKEHGIK